MTKSTRLPDVVHIYKHFKTLLNTENYLTIELQYTIRKALARVRCSSYPFNIEVGRKLGILQENRICNHCLITHSIRCIEAEFHAFFQCTKCLNERNTYLDTWYTGERNCQCFIKLKTNTNPQLNCFVFKKNIHL